MAWSAEVELNAQLGGDAGMRLGTGLRKNATSAPTSLAVSTTRLSSGSTPHRSARARITAAASADDPPRPARSGIRSMMLMLTSGETPMASPSRCAALYAVVFSAGIASAGSCRTTSSSASSITRVSVGSMGSMNTTLKSLVKLLDEKGLVAATRNISTQSAETLVSGVDCDSRVPCAGHIFVCKGQAFKPQYLSVALGKGAIAYLCDVEHADELESAAPGVPAIVSSDLRPAMRDAREGGF